VRGKLKGRNSAQGSEPVAQTKGSREKGVSKRYRTRKRLRKLV